MQNKHEDKHKIQKMYTKMSEKELSSRLKYFLDAGDSSWKSIPEATDANSRAPTDSAYLTRLEEQNTKIADFINILDASLDEKAEAVCFYTST